MTLNIGSPTPRRCSNPGDVPLEVRSQIQHYATTEQLSHPLVSLHNGFRGLLDDNIHELFWLGVDNWSSCGGSELGTIRTLPDVDLGAVAARFQEHNFHALLMIGGFEAFNALLSADP
ncbi:hypothetical protein DEU56DRAFT_912821 [Suillus clintonianus]|uniref:uncharacterized protein n=1 Tax=Suillus clintonianus TaxID=1904413 RepID=UPI001B882DC9|nr:uncharacterized protein DEU56DRAFT_912821 [Suillus clintonianus]KAG2137051.1 hypothetical protein DEU56DRAFT_912821 [Suillus clintonianus]